MELDGTWYLAQIEIEAMMAGPPITSGPLSD